jgi:hypothetical protein
MEVLWSPLQVVGDFHTFLVNFFIVDPMLLYEIILTWEESQAVMVPSSPCWLLAPTLASGYIAIMSC